MAEHGTATARGLDRRQILLVAASVIAWPSSIQSLAVSIIGVVLVRRRCRRRQGPRHGRLRPDQARQPARHHRRPLSRARAAAGHRHASPAQPPDRTRCRRTPGCWPLGAARRPRPPRPRRRGGSASSAGSPACPAPAAAGCGPSTTWPTAIWRPRWRSNAWVGAVPRRARRWWLRVGGSRLRGAGAPLATTRAALAALGRRLRAPSARCACSHRSPGCSPPREADRRPRRAGRPRHRGQVGAPASRG